MAKSKYNLNVFINCPFDEKYEPLFHALVFTIFDCGFVPRCSLEDSNSGIVRYEKIKTLIAESRFGVHDISRAEIDPKTKLPRFNMPFELGIFIGARDFGESKHKSKNCLILDSNEYRFRKSISDISGQDISSHSNKVSKIINCTRNWLQSTSKNINIPGGDEIAKRYRSFRKELPKICDAKRIKLKKLTYNDYSRFVFEWLRLDETTKK